MPLTAPRGDSWALVAGAAGGIGSAVCKRLSAAGLAVIGVDRRAGQGIDRCDLADAAARAALLGRLLDAPARAPSVAVWAAGTYERRPMSDYNEEAFRRAIDDNLTAAFFVVQRVVAAMRFAGGGRIVLVSSQAGASGGTDAAYAAAKAGLTALGKSVAREHARAGIACNVVSPGPTDTPMAKAMGERRGGYERAMPIGRLARAEEVADAVAFLALVDAPAVTGATLDVDGGLLRR